MKYDCYYICYSFLLQHLAAMLFHTPGPRDIMTEWPKNVRATQGYTGAECRADAPESNNLRKEVAMWKLLGGGC